jgi:spore coat polysaccharide biosynthesis protein SpsF
MTNTTPQENFWSGQFGNDYVDRNKGTYIFSSNLAFFSKILGYTQNIKSVLELGANIGMNLMAINQLIPQINISAVEINEKAASELKKNLPGIDLHLTSILKFTPDRSWDLVFTRGVLIHLNPDMLPMVYDLIYKSASRYILISEYYSPKPTEIDYRGHSGKLFKRDFAGEILDLFPNLNLLNYGFIYHRDNNFPQDDMNWFLMEKKYPNL